MWTTQLRDIKKAVCQERMDNSSLQPGRMAEVELALQRDEGCWALFRKIEHSQSAHEQELLSTTPIAFGQYWWLLSRTRTSSELNNFRTV
jgi:hypothetical protein